MEPAHKPQGLGVQNSILQQVVTGRARGQTFDILGGGRGGGRL